MDQTLFLGRLVMANRLQSTRNSKAGAGSKGLSRVHILRFVVIVKHGTTVDARYSKAAVACVVLWNVSEEGI